MFGDVPSIFPETEHCTHPCTVYQPPTQHKSLKPQAKSICRNLNAWGRNLLQSLEITTVAAEISLNLSEHGSFTSFYHIAISVFTTELL